MSQETQSTKHFTPLPTGEGLVVRPSGVRPSCPSCALLSTTYFGPIQWYQKLHRYDHCLLEQHESFIKQTYRNRCVIATANGPQTLSIPVTHADSMYIRDIRISDHANWRHQHWNALTSAYGESPFFEYYQDDIRPFFEQRWEFLFDFNLAITHKMIELLDIRPHIGLTEEYKASPPAPLPLSPKGCLPEQEGEGSKMPPDPKTIKQATQASAANHSPLLGEGLGGEAADPMWDFRYTIRPKHAPPDPDFTPRRYYQVYEQRHGFLPNLSILDLLFNEGNEAIFYL